MKLTDFLNSINSTKKNILDGCPEAERLYTPFVVNRCLSYFPDTIMQSNEMNMSSHMDSKIQYDYLLNSTRSRRRFSKWFKIENDSDVELIKQHYNINTRRAREYKKLMTKENIISLRNLWSSTENPK
ncbi:MAG: DNA polymerase clamp loader subunit A [Proteobacteria bacterium]|nr:DNA polymerase clamp loader subunit A [Pseudomonadota bacterium]